MAGPEVRTQRILLRPIRLSDAEDIFEIRKCTEVMQWTSSIHPDRTIRDTITWLETKILNNPSTVYNFSIELLPPPSNTTTSTPLQHKNRVIGAIGAVRGPEIGYMINPTYWHSGYATEALQAFIPLFWAHVPPFRTPHTSTTLPLPSIPLFTDARYTLSAPTTSAAPPLAPPEEGTLLPFSAGHDYMEAVIDPMNVGSAMVLRKCGFRLWRASEDDFVSPTLGLRSTAVHRLGRPGVELIMLEEKGRSGFA